MTSLGVAALCSLAIAAALAGCSSGTSGAGDGKPLYTYAADTRRGDIKGDNVGNVWHVIR